MPVKISTLTPIVPDDADKLEIAQKQPNGWATKGISVGTLKQAIAAPPVDSVFGRTGAVAAQSGDYDASQIDETASAKILTGAERSKLAGVEPGATQDQSASEVDYSNSGSGLTATDVQAALDEIDNVVDSLTSNAVRLRGSWDASTGSFPSGADNGDTYIVSTGGTVDGVDFNANDRILATTDNASTSTYSGNWLKLDYTDQVLSVAGKTGAVTLSVSDLTDSGTVVRSSALKANGGTIPETDNPAQYTAQQNFAAQTLTDGANISWNLNTQQAANVTLGGDRTLDNPSNMVDGGTYTLIVKQDATGGRSLSFGSAYKWPSGNPPVLTTAANAVDILTFISDGTNMYGVAEYAFS